MVALRLAYAGHACRTQGAEAPVVLVVPGDHHTSLESGYSSLSRGQEEIHVFADTTTHGGDPIAHLAERWQQPGPKRRATARAREWASQITTEPPAAVVPPVGGGPMTGRQAAYLATLAAQAGEEATEALTRLEATGRITELQERTGRRTPEWARKIASEIAEIDAAPPPPTAGQRAPVAARLAEERSKLRSRAPHSPSAPRPARVRGTGETPPRGWDARQ